MRDSLVVDERIFPASGQSEDTDLSTVHTTHTEYARDHSSNCKPFSIPTLHIAQLPSIGLTLQTEDISGIEKMSLHKTEHDLRKAPRSMMTTQAFSHIRWGLKLSILYEES